MARPAKYAPREHRFTISAGAQPIDDTAELDQHSTRIRKACAADLADLRREHRPAARLSSGCAA